MQYPNSVLMSEQSILKALMENQEWNMKQGLKTEREIISASQETGHANEINAEVSSVMSNFGMARRPFDDQGGPSVAAAPDCFWTY